MTTTTPNSYWYFFFAVLLAPALWLKYRIRITGNLRHIPKPAILVCSHMSNLDFLFLAFAMLPTRLNFVCSANYFSNPLFRFLLANLGAISKRQFSPDVAAMRSISKILANDGVVAIFPSGQSSFAGQSTPINTSIAKLIKHFAVPVISVRLSGANLALPKWNMSWPRKSRVAAERNLLLSKDDCRELSREEIYYQVCHALRFDDYEDMREMRPKLRSRKPRSAKGLEKILFLCPVCHCEYTISTKRNRVYCSACGYKVKMDHTGYLEGGGFDTPTQWYRWQKEYLDETLQDEACWMIDTVQLIKVEENNERVPVGAAHMTLDCHTLHIECAALGREMDINHKIHPIFGREDPREIVVGSEGKQYSLLFDNPCKAAKAIAIKELLFDRQLKMFQSSITEKFTVRR